MVRDVIQAVALFNVMILVGAGCLEATVMTSPILDVPLYTTAGSSFAGALALAFFTIRQVRARR